VSRVLVIVNDPSDPIGPLGDWLSSAGVQLQILDAFAGADVPASLDGFDGLLVLGGHMAATDDVQSPWLPAVRALLAAAVADEIPTLGVCLGGQLLAVATGGVVGANPDGPEYGAQLIAKRANSATDPLFGPLPITPDVIQWHVDAVTQLPPGAVLLANSPGCDVQAFRVGRLAWGLQFHIETTPEIVRQWAVEDGEAIENYDIDRMLSRSDAAHEDIAEVWQPFAAAWAAIVDDPASVRPARPLRISTAEPITDPAEIRAALAAQMQASRPQNMPPQNLPWPSPVDEPPIS
jgi:GMP synthase (glutamine-hydrolysing)